MSVREDPTVKARRVWDAMAPRYDKDISFFEKVQFGGGREWVCSRASGDVLEVGIGTGRNLSFYPGDVRITGIELSPAMLDIAPPTSRRVRPARGATRRRCRSSAVRRRII